MGWPSILPCNGPGGSKFLSGLPRLKSICEQWLATLAIAATCGELNPCVHLTIVKSKCIIHMGASPSVTVSLLKCPLVWRNAPHPPLLCHYDFLSISLTKCPPPHYVIMFFCPLYQTDTDFPKNTDEYRLMPINTDYRLNKSRAWTKIDSQTPPPHKNGLQPLN